MTMDGDEKCFHSWSSQENIAEVKNKKRRCINSYKKPAMEDLLNGDPWRSMVPRKGRSTKIPVINMKEEEKKKAALALMVLSKATHPWGAQCSCSQPFDDTDEYFNAAVTVCENHVFKKPVRDADDFGGKQWKKEVVRGDDCRGSGFKSIKKINRMFECGICGRVFGSGQGLGCHKRVHKVAA